MQIDLTTALSILSTIATLAFGAWLATAKYAVNNREREIDSKINKCETKIEVVDMRLHTEEKATIRQDGEIKLVQQTHGNLNDDIHDIKDTMVTKAELNHLSRAIDDIGRKIDVRDRTDRGRFTPGHIPRVDPDPSKGR